VTAETAAMVRCDYLDHGKPPAERACREVVTDGTYRPDRERTPGLPEHVYLWTIRDARREARRLGWAVGVHMDRTRGGRLDYCPAHKGTPGGAA
jgi:hypothetical protein